MESLRIIFQDESLIAIDKPSGLLVHRSYLDRRETRFAVQMLRDQIGRHVHPVHRLDRGTSGVLVFALDKETGSALSAQFQSRSVDKTYLAVVRGHPDESGSIDHPLVRLRDESEFRPENSSNAPQDSLTHFRCLARTELPYRVDRYPTSRYSLLELKPETGRQHQIRRHLKHLSHPVIGDTSYGKGRHNRLFEEKFGCRRLLLACTAMTFCHPVSGKTVCMNAFPSADFVSVLEQLGWLHALNA